MNDFHSSDFAQNLNMLVGTLGNLRMDSPHLMTDDQWSFVLETVGAEAYTYGRARDWMHVRMQLSVVFVYLNVEDVPKSLRMRLRETVEAIGT
jgi:hypothetical protein